MKSTNRIALVLSALMFCAIGGTATQTANAGFYKNPPLFSTAPSETKAIQTIMRFGPVGMGIDLVQPAFRMKIHNIEEGSPAEATGKFKVGQIIESINGQVLKDIDPRIQLGRIVTAAEAADGVITFVVKDTPDAKATEAVVRIPALGAYSDTWPLQCDKSERIVRNFADYLATPGANKGFSGLGSLFLLSTGEAKDLALAKKWIYEAAKGTPSYSWHLGYGGIPLCEYYLRTGDKKVLPAIQRWVGSAAKREYLGGWSQKGGVGAVTYGGGGGHLNAGGTAVVTFLMLARECGVKVPDHTLHRVLRHFYRFVGKGNNPYGDGRPEGSFVDNGKNGNLAFAMAAAASLTPDGEKSIYARARDSAAMSSFYTSTYMLHGHTGGGIGEIWRSAAMGLLREKRPTHYREFMNARKWHYELSRRWDGSFCILGGARYDNTNWGAGYALGYTIPRKTLRITGAPPSRFSNKYRLPERPWGVKADDAFNSIKAAADKDGKRQDLDRETFANGSGKSVVERLTPTGLGDEVIRRYAHHPDPAIRVLATVKTVGITGKYMGVVGANDKMRPALLLELLTSADARVRRAALDACRADKSGKSLTKKVFELTIGMIKDPAESWWVKDAALNLIGQAPADRVAPHVDLLMGYLKHEEWWLQNAALTALAPVVADERCYRKVLPAMGELLRTCQRFNVTSPVRWGLLPDNLRKASPAVRKLARDTIRTAYTDYAGVRLAPGGQDITRTLDSHLEFLATAMAGVPGGYDTLYDMAKRRFPTKSLPYAEVFLKADPKDFGPELKKAIRTIIAERLIPEFIGQANHAVSNRAQLLSEAASAEPFRAGYYIGEPRMEGLVRLYQRMGVHDYDWRDFGPTWNQMQWDYHSFDPPETKPWEPGWRYRKVTAPKGMANWYAVDFDAKKAGWKRGPQPFGQEDGELRTVRKLWYDQEIGRPVHLRRPCRHDFCRCAEPMRTFWDKEVLLMRGRFKFPPFKEGHRYRLVIGGLSHVNGGDGFRVYINGKLLLERKTGVGKRAGDRPICYYLDKAWWPNFQGGETMLAATSFLRIHLRSKVKGNHFSVWLQEMRVPPLGQKVILNSATVKPMLSSAWQARQDPDDAELDTNADRFLWDGKFVPNKTILGRWTTVDQVQTIDEFTPDKRPNPRRGPLKEITFKPDGRTAQRLWIWSGKTLMDLHSNQATKMTVKTIGGTDYLFVEVGGFSLRHPKGWKTPWYVMKKSTN